MRKKITIIKQRGLDAIIEDSFKFFRTHAKNILKILWEQNRFIITALVISYFVYIYYYFGMFNKILTIPGQDSSGNSGMFESPLFIGVFLTLIVLGLIFFPRFFSAITGYIKIYDEQDGGEVDEQQVKLLVNNKFWGLIGLTLIIGFTAVLIFSFVVFFLVGIMKSISPVLIIILLPVVLLLLVYLAIYISLSYYVYFFENIGIFEAIVKTKKYLKNKFWFSFGVIFVMSLIIGLIGMVLNAPVSIYVLVKTIWMTKNQEIAGYAGQGDLIVSLISVVSYVGQTILRILMFIAMSLLYFSLREYHTGESLLDKINKIDVKEDATS